MSDTQIPKVTVDGRTVTVTFELPFAVGDECITPRNYERTRVSRIPEIAIHLENNLSKCVVQHGGSWYSESHTQMHGTRDFLPTPEALLEFWLNEKERSYFEGRMKDLFRMFANDQTALERIKARHTEMLEAEISAEKSILGNSIVASTQKVLGLEAALLKARSA